MPVFIVLGLQLFWNIISPSSVKDRRKPPQPICEIIVRCFFSPPDIVENIFLIRLYCVIIIISVSINIIVIVLLYKDEGINNNGK